MGLAQVGRMWPGARGPREQGLGLPACWMAAARARGSPSGSVDTHPVAGEMQRVTVTLPRLRQETKWENTHKEACLRLDGIPLHGNSHMRRARLAW